MNPSNNLFLIGPMGAGKTVLGKRLARRYGLQFIDLDACISTTADTSIRDIFAQQGEPYFRQLESAELERISPNSGIVMATGGGAVLAEVNRQLLTSYGFVLYLEIDISTQLQRLVGDTKRPLLDGVDLMARLQGLSQQRNPIYQRLADCTLRVGSDLPIGTETRALALLAQRWQFPGKEPVT
ncbi:MAG TPA: shikimate kinase [Mizugakiibacter sp.]|nr:shikimate kinase [Mizugakiibacter sp.]